MSFFSKLIKLTAIAVVVAAVYLFVKTERLDKQLTEIKPKAEANFADWQQQNNCLVDSLPCADYTTQFRSWLSQFELYKENKEKTLQFRAYRFLKELDGLYAPNLNSNGKAALALLCSAVLLWFLLVARLFGGKKKKINTPSIKTRSIIPPEINAQPDAQALLRKAAECAEKEPAQAINYFEQALKESLSAKLTAPTLLMCGSLRLKNKIGKKQGKKQLNKIISDWPQSLEAQKAKTVLETFK
jgi:hypothetical protein